MNAERGLKERQVLPERRRIRQRITVVGAGIAGATTAWMMSELGYDVTLIDQLSGLLAGTSKGALAIYNGGRYPQYPEIAKECLMSAIKLKKLMPFAENKTMGKMRFLIANDSEVSLDEYVQFYFRQRDLYASLPVEDHVFGPPQDFFRLMTPEELVNFQGMQGGVVTQEMMWDMPKVKKVLEATLAERGVTTLYQTTVTGIEPAEKGFSLSVQSADGDISTIASDIVINAAGYGARTLSQELGDAPLQNSQLRVFTDVQVDKATQDRYPFPFDVITTGMHYYPYGDGTVSIAVPGTNELDHIVVGEGEKTTIPDAWQGLMRDGGDVLDLPRARRMIATARESMPHLSPATEPVEMFPGVAVLLQHGETYTTVEKQNRLGLVEDMPGYIRLVPTKASHGISLALDAADYVLHISKREGIIEETTPYQEQVLSGKFVAYIE